MFKIVSNDIIKINVRFKILNFVEILSLKGEC